MDNPPRKSARLSGRAKFLVDFGPLLVFFIAYFFGHRLAPLAGALVGRNWALADGEELFLAMGAFMPAFAAAFAYSVWKERRIAPMLLVSGVVIGVLGGLALVFHNRVFVYVKPTIVYLFFAIGLAGGLATGRNFLKTLFDGAFHLDEDAWRILTKRYIVFFIALAIANEAAWRWLTRDCDLTAAAKCAGEPLWVNLKIWGFTGVNIVFAGLQAPFLAKHMHREPARDSDQNSRPD
ncbi:MAG TPA: inner membrane-spanning protein YciB [Parvularculaceae bacterium]|nr:inner membrane-spanning protein YciB [Parvularculaceae bacterium]